MKNFVKARNFSFLRKSMTSFRLAEEIKINKNISLIILEVKKKEFKKNLLLRACSKPIDRFNSTIELARRILQLLLLLYKWPVKGDGIKAIIHMCWKKRTQIAELKRCLERNTIPEDKFIIFCFWYLNKNAMKIYLAFNWIVSDAYNELMKTEALDPNIWQYTYKFADNLERGKKLITLVKSIDTDELKNNSYFDE